MDTTLIAVPPSTKNKRRKRDPEMSATKKGNWWQLSMKVRIGADADCDLVHSLIFMKAMVLGNKMLKDLMHGEENAVHGDKAYTSNKHSLLARDPEPSPIWCMPFTKPSGRELPKWKRYINHRLASLRAIVGFPFRSIKRQFHPSKVCYQGLFKNGSALTAKFALANFYTMRRTLLSSTEYVYQIFGNREKNSAEMVDNAVGRAFTKVGRSIHH